MNKRLLIVFAALVLLGLAIIAVKLLLKEENEEEITPLEECANYFEYPETNPSVGDTVDLNTVESQLEWQFIHTEIKDIEKRYSGKNGYVVFEEPGPYLGIVSNSNCRDSFNIEVSENLVDEEFETIDLRIVGPARGKTGRKYTFTAKGAPAKKYAWYFESGMGVQGDKKSATHKFVRAGKYQVKLILDGGKYTTTKTVVINPAPPPNTGGGGSPGPINPNPPQITTSAMAEQKKKTLKAIISNGAPEDPGYNAKRFTTLSNNFEKKLCGDCQIFVNNKKIKGPVGLTRRLKSDAKYLGITISNVSVEFDRASNCINKVSITAPNY